MFELQHVCVTAADAGIAGVFCLLVVFVAFVFGRASANGTIAELQEKLERIEPIVRRYES